MGHSVVFEALIQGPCAHLVSWKKTETSSTVKAYTLTTIDLMYQPTAFTCNLWD